MSRLPKKSGRIDGPASSAAAMRFLLVGIGLLGLLALLPQPQHTARVLDRVQGQYQEDEAGGRMLAALDARLLHGMAAPRLDLRISALGPGVDPALGSQGLPGGNHVTARELEELCQERALDLVRRGSDGGRWPLRPGTMGPIPEIRLGPEGRLQTGVPSRDQFLLDASGQSGPLPQGRHTLYLEARGVPRLAVEVMIGPHEASILGMKSLGAHHLEILP